MIVSREDLVRMVQCHLLPFLPSSAVQARMAGIDLRTSHVRGIREPRYDAPEILHQLWLEVPEIFEERERRSLPLEMEFLAWLREQRGDVVRNYHIHQTVRLRPEALPGVGVLSFWIPVPRWIPGVQEVRVRSLWPASLRERYLPEAGLIYDLSALVDSFNDPPPKFDLCFEVTQSLSGLLHMRDNALTPMDRPTPTSVRKWLDDRGLDRPAAPKARVASLLRAMDADLSGTVQDSGSTDALLRSGSGSVETLSAFMASALLELGLATRLGGGQALMLCGESSTLSFPNSLGYEHRFVHWSDERSRTCGTVDLSYFGRWGSDAQWSTRPEAARTHLDELRRAYCAVLREQVYPVDFIVSGVARPSFFMNLDSPEERLWRRPGYGLDTEIRAERLRGDL